MIISERLTSLAGLRVPGNTSLTASAASSTEDVASDVGTLRVTVDNDVSARALGVEVGDLVDTVDGSLSNLVAERSTVGSVELDVHVVAGLSISGELGAGSVHQGESAGIVVGRIIATGHEDDHIGAGRIELGSGGALRNGKGRESAKGEGVADERHY